VCIGAECLSAFFNTRVKTGVGRLTRLGTATMAVDPSSSATATVVPSARCVCDARCAFVSWPLHADECYCPVSRRGLGGAVAATPARGPPEADGNEDAVKLLLGVDAAAAREAAASRDAAATNFWWTKPTEPKETAVRNKALVQLGPFSRSTCVCIPCAASSVCSLAAG
jgi:hypothetical protein